MLAGSRIGWLAIGLVVAGPRVAAAQVDSTKARAPGFYTDAQGARGADVYQGQCARCHSIADHTGADFRLAWHGQSVKSLYDYLRGSMPDDDPGTLTDQQYLDVTAYLLKLNGMPSGDSALVADTTALRKLIIDIKAVGSAASGTERLPRRLRALLRERERDQ